MKNTIYLVITNLGDGSNGIEYYRDPKSIGYLDKCMKYSNREYFDWERYASGDGLQVKEIIIPCTHDEWAALQPSWFGWDDEELFQDETDDEQTLGD